MRVTTTPLVTTVAPAGVKAFQREMLKPFEMPMQMDNGNLLTTQLRRLTYLSKVGVTYSVDSLPHSLTHSLTTCVLIALNNPCQTTYVDMLVAQFHQATRQTCMSQWTREQVRMCFMSLNHAPTELCCATACISPTEKNCLQLAHQMLPPQAVLGRTYLARGSDAPAGCSIMSGGDWTAYFQSNESDAPVDKHPDYTRVCTGYSPSWCDYSRAKELLCRTQIRIR